MTDNLQILTKLYHNPDNFTGWDCSPGAVDLYTQPIPLLHADPFSHLEQNLLIWACCTESLGLVLQCSQADAAEMRQSKAMSLFFAGIVCESPKPTRPSLHLPLVAFLGCRKVGPLSGAQVCLASPRPLVTGKVN